jgi:hypothetical protein
MARTQVHHLRSEAMLRRECGLAVVYLALLLVVAGAFLFSPRPTNERYCGERVDVGGRVSFLFHCDSEEFMRVAIHPSRLLQARSTRQSRPVVPLLAVPLTYLILLPVQKLHLAPPSVRTAIARHTTSLNQNQAVSSYTAYIALNAAIVVIGLLMFNALVSGPRSLVLAAAVLLLADDFVKTFFWTPHTEMLNLVVPLGGILVSRSLLREPARDVRFFALLGALIGLLTLAYGSFLIWAPIAVTSLALRRQWSGIGRRVIVLVVAMLVPIVAWVATCLATAGSYYSPEVSDFRQFVWILDAIHQGNLAHAFTHNINRYALRLRQVALLPAALALGAAVAGLCAGIRWSTLGEQRRQTLVATGITTTFVVLFYGLQGYYQPRLAWTIVPPLVVVFGILMSAIAERSTGSLRTAATVATVCVAAVAFGVAWARTSYWYAEAAPQLHASTGQYTMKTYLKLAPSGVRIRTVYRPSFDGWKLTAHRPLASVRRLART